MVTEQGYFFIDVRTFSETENIMLIVGQSVHKRFVMLPRE